MELSEHESRILQEIQQDLTASDPRLARVLTTATIQGRAIQHLLLGTAVLGPSLGLMLFALILGSMPLGAVAFTAMTAGAYVASARFPRFRTKRRLSRKSVRSQILPDQ